MIKQAMNYFTIRDIENLSGIKAHTLRIWEQRYSFYTPKRKNTGRRIYNNEDLKRLLHISFLYHNGWKVSKIAELTPEQIIEEVQKTVIATHRSHTYIFQLLEAALDFDEPAFNKIFESAIKQVGFESCITDVCYPYLQRVGLLWLTNHVLPAQEHFSSYLIQHKIIAETDKLPIPPQNSELILLFTPKGEHHELPLLFINYLMRKNNWSTIYMGSNVKINQLKQVVNDKPVQYLFLHLITNFTGVSVDDYLHELCSSFLHLTIVASGNTIFNIQRNFLNLVTLKSDKEIKKFIEQKDYALGST